MSTIDDLENDWGTPIPNWPECPADLFRCHRHAAVNRPFTAEERAAYLRCLVALAHSATEDTMIEVADALAEHSDRILYALMPDDGSPWCKPCGCGPPDPWDPRRAPLAGCHLYRLWGEGGRLLYVGVSVKLRSRLRTHLKRWGDLIERVTWDEHPDERSMLAAEREAIQTEYPALNRAGV